MQGVTPEHTFELQTANGAMTFHYLSARQYMQTMKLLQQAEQSGEDQHLEALLGIIKLGHNDPGQVDGLADAMTFEALSDLATEMIRKNRVLDDDAKKSAPRSPICTDGQSSGATAAVQTIG